MRIVNKRKFIRTTTILVIFIISFIVFTNKAYSNVEIGYKEEYIYSGDTLWKIANNEGKSNEYFKNKNIGDIIIELKKINNLKSAELYVGDKIIIPVYK